MVCDKCNGTGQIKPQNPYIAAVEEVRDTMKSAINKTYKRARLGVLKMIINKISNIIRTFGSWVTNYWFPIIVTLAVTCFVFGMCYSIDHDSSKLVTVQYNDKGDVSRCWVGNDPELHDHYADKMSDDDSPKAISKALVKLGAPANMKCIR